MASKPEAVQLPAEEDEEGSSKSGKGATKSQRSDRARPQESLPSAVTTNEQAREANRLRREANQAAYEKSIEGQELPPSVIEAQEQEAEQRKLDEQAAKEAEADLARTTEMIANQPGSTQEALQEKGR